MKNVKRTIAIGLTALGLMVSLGNVTAHASEYSSWRRLSEQDAKNVVLRDAGVNANDVMFTDFELDDEDGFLVYEIKFYVNGVKYSYDIDTETGAIIKKKVKSTRKAKKHNKRHHNNVTYIGAESAKQIAAAHAGLHANSVFFEKAKLDRENGIMVYEVEFSTYDYEYEYDIDAVTGRIVKFSVDEADD